VVVVISEEQFYSAVSAGCRDNFTEVGHLLFVGVRVTVKVVAQNKKLGKVSVKVPFPKGPAVDIAYGKAAVLFAHALIISQTSLLRKRAPLIRQVFSVP
jgi:hypothetical protein